MIQELIEMALGILAKKIGMTQLFLEDGLCVAVTVLQVEKNTIVQKKTVANDGYNALQVGTGTVREKLRNKPELGHFAKHNVGPQRLLREFRVDDATAGKLNTGDAVGFDLIKDAKSLDISGTSKGKGTAGVMKRHNMSGFRATHGTHEYFRHGGSIGCRATPGKVHKGKRMSGRMGDERVTVQNLMLVQVDEEKGLIFVRGAVPGAKQGYVEVRASTHNAKRGKALRDAAQIASKNPMKASKAGGGAAKKK
jgi:large subunit ribosomal protein L3